MNVIFEDNHLLITDKPSGILTQGDYTGEKTFLDEAKEYIKTKYCKSGNVFLGTVHRLDRQVSGLLAFARTSKAASRLSEEFRNRKTKKIYIAVIHKNSRYIPDMVHSLSGYIKRIHDKSFISEKKTGDSQDCSLKFYIAAENERFYLAVIKLETGRKHQIRAQMSHADMSVAGDEKYGSSIKTDGDSILLHSYFLEFNHPVKKEPVSFKSDIPERFYALIKIDADLQKKIDYLCYSGFENN